MQSLSITLFHYCVVIKLKSNNLKMCRYFIENNIYSDIDVIDTNLFRYITRLFRSYKTHGTYTTQHNNICNNLTFKSFPNPFLFLCITRVSFVRIPEFRCAFTAFSTTYTPTHILFHVILKIIIYATSIRTLASRRYSPSFTRSTHTHHAKLSIIHFQAQTSHSCLNAPLHTYMHKSTQRLGSTEAAA